MKILKTLFILILLVAAEDLYKLPLHKSSWEVEVCFNKFKEKYYWVATSLAESRTGISSSLISYDLYKDSINAKLGFIVFAKVNSIKDYYFK